jgi:hypothetical protein
MSDSGILCKAGHEKYLQIGSPFSRSFRHLPMVGSMFFIASYLLLRRPSN